MGLHLKKDTKSKTTKVRKTAISSHNVPPSLRRTATLGAATTVRKTTKKKKTKK